MLKRIFSVVLFILLVTSTLTLVFSTTAANRTKDVKLVGTTDPSAQTDWWPMFHHDLNHLGYSTSKAPDTNKTLWSYSASEGAESSPAVADGKVYVGSDDHNIYCLDALNGTQIWSYATGSYVLSSPAVADGKVYVGPQDNHIYCFGMLHDVAITNVTPSKTVVGQGYGENITVTSANQGDSSETFNVTVYANTTFMTSQNVTLTSGSSTTITFAWDTTSFAKGNYTISAYAWPVPGETDTSNNNFTCPLQVHVGVPGDVSSTIPGVYDGVDNMKDIAYMVALFNTRPSSPNWNPNADVNNDSVCNMREIAICVAHFNQRE